MANIHDEKAQLAQNLQDAGCDQYLTQKILQYMQDDRAESRKGALCLLRRHKQTLLAQLHADERKIDSLDYLIYRLQQEKG